MNYILYYMRFQESCNRESMKKSVTTIQKSVNNLEYIPRVFRNPFNVERIGYIQDKTELIDRYFILPSVLFIFDGHGFLEENGSRMELCAPFLMWNWPGERKKYTSDSGKARRRT